MSMEIKCVISENSMNLGNGERGKLVLRTTNEKSVGVSKQMKIFWTDLAREIAISLGSRQHTKVIMVGFT